jgi:hypothetical protein
MKLGKLKRENSDSEPSAHRETRKIQHDSQGSNGIEEKGIVCSSYINFCSEQSMLLPRKQPASQTDPKPRRTAVWCTPEWARRGRRADCNSPDDHFHDQYRKVKYQSPRSGHTATHPLLSTQQKGINGKKMYGIDTSPRESSEISTVDIKAPTSSQ